MDKIIDSYKIKEKEIKNQIFNEFLYKTFILEFNYEMEKILFLESFS